MPRKKKEVSVEPEVVIEEVKSMQVEVKSTQNTICHNCKRDNGRLVCSKGDSNQYQFCTIRCYNEDKTV